MTTAPEEIQSPSASDGRAFVEGVAQLLGLLVRGTALMLSVTAICMSVLCLGGVFSDRLDALTHVVPVWMTMGASAICLGGLFSRNFERRAIVILGLGSVLICSAFVLPEYWSRLAFKPSMSFQDDLKVVQFNVWHLNQTPQKAVGWIIGQKADVIIIEEAGSERTSILQGLRAAYPYASCDKGAGCETLIFSRYAMTARGGNRTEGPYASTAWATLMTPRGPFSVIGVHYSWPLPAGTQQEQAHNLARTVSRFDKKTTIVAGDFNSTPWSFTLRRQDKALGLHRWTRALPSWPAGQFTRVAAAPAPLLPIDHVYAGSSWRAVTIERGPVLGSDHRPIVATFTRSKE